MLAPCLQLVNLKMSLKLTIKSILPEKTTLKKPSLIRVKGKNVSVQISVIVNPTSNLV